MVSVYQKCIVLDCSTPSSVCVLLAVGKEFVLNEFYFLLSFFAEDIIKFNACFFIKMLGLTVLFSFSSIFLSYSTNSTFLFEFRASVFPLSHPIMIFLLSPSFLFFWTVWFQFLFGEYRNCPYFLLSFPYYCFQFSKSRSSDGVSWMAVATSKVCQRTEVRFYKDKLHDLCYPWFMHHKGSSVWSTSLSAEESQSMLSSMIEPTSCKKLTTVHSLAQNSGEWLRLWWSNLGSKLLTPDPRIEAGIVLWLFYWIQWILLVPHCS